MPLQEFSRWSAVATVTTAMQDKVLTKETARTAFDGTLFPATEAALKQKKLGSKKHN